MSDLAAKLHASRFDGMSARMAAIIGYLVGEDYASPSITNLVVTSDGVVLAEHEGSPGTTGFIGSADDLHRNLNELIAAAGLTGEEEAEFRALIATRVTRYERVSPA